MDNEIPLLGWCNWTASKRSVDIERCSFRKVWCIDYNVSNIVEGAPIAPEIFDVDLVID
jgi:hypothetical protein